MKEKHIELVCSHGCQKTITQQEADNIMYGSVLPKCSMHGDVMQMYEVIEDKDEFRLRGQAVRHICDHRVKTLYREHNLRQVVCSLCHQVLFEAEAITDDLFSKDRTKR